MMKTDVGPENPAANAGRAWGRVFHTLPPIEQARIIARVLAGKARWCARRRGEPEPVILTFDGTLTPGRGVTQTSPLRDFDL